MLFALAPALGLLLVTEAVLRLGSFRLDVTALRVEHSGVHTVRMFESHLTSKHFVADPVTFWKPRPGYPPFNSFGYRGAEMTEEKADGELRILAVGDSNTVGHVTSWVDEMPNAARGGPWEGRLSILNAGVYGYTSYQGKHHLKRFLPYRPDVVLIGFGGNDAALNQTADKDHVPYTPHPFYAFFHRRLAVVNLLEYLSVRLALARSPRAPAQEDLTSRVSPADYEANLVAMVELARSAGALPVLVTRPLAQNYHAPLSQSRLKPYYTSTLDAAKKSGAAVIDLDSMANHSWVLFVDHSHFNVEGHRLMGSYVFAELTKILAGESGGEVPRFLPRNRDEKAVHVVGRVVRSWYRLEENVEKLRRDPRIKGLRAVYESDFEEGTGGWRISLQKAEDPAPVTKDGALCFPRLSGVVTLSHEELGLAEPWSHFLWIEARTRSDVSLKVFWRSEDGFDPGNSVSMAFYYRGEDTTLHFPHTLPAGTREVRLDVTPIRWEGDLCLGKIYLAELKVAGRPKAASPPGP